MFDELRNALMIHTHRNTVVAENRENLQGSLSNIREVSSRLRVSADNLNEITAKVAQGEGTIGKLVNEDTTSTT